MKKVGSLDQNGGFIMFLSIVDKEVWINDFEFESQYLIPIKKYYQ